MHGPKILGVGLLMAAFVVGCSSASPEEAVMKEQISIMNEMSAVLENVKDEKAGKEVEEKMNNLKKRSEDLQKKAQGLSKEKLEQAAKKHEAEFKAAGERFGKAMIGSMKFMGGGGLIPKFPE